MKEFPHTAPKGYSYEYEELKKNYTAIWIRNHYKFIYNGCASVRSIWGFYNHKTKCYHSPINSKTVGDQVNIEETTPYSAMILKLTPLQAAFV
jgi:hypothetical protein